MPVEPDLPRVGEVGTDLDEGGTEVVVPQVEVVAGHAAVDPVIGEPHRARPALNLAGGEHSRVLLCHADRHHPGPAGSRRLAHQRHHLIDLPLRPRAVGQHTRSPAGLLPGEADHRDVIGLSEGQHSPAERLPAALQQHRRGNRLAQVSGEEPGDLTTHHQVRHRQSPEASAHRGDR